MAVEALFKKIFSCCFGQDDDDDDDSFLYGVALLFHEEEVVAQHLIHHDDDALQSAEAHDDAFLYGVAQLFQEEEVVAQHLIHHDDDALQSAEAHDDAFLYGVAQLFQEEEVVAQHLIHHDDDALQSAEAHDDAFLYGVAQLFQEEEVVAQHLALVVPQRLHLKPRLNLPSFARKFNPNRVGLAQKVNHTPSQKKENNRKLTAKKIAKFKKDKEESKKKKGGLYQGIVSQQADCKLGFSLSQSATGKKFHWRLETEGCQQRIETRICALPDDLLLQILHHVPTKEAVATSILSKRWRYVWTMVPRLEFKDEGSESVGWFIEKSLQLHKAPKLDGLIVEIGPHCPFDVDVGKWVENAVNRDVEDLDFKLLWTAEPTRFPKCLYTCDTLVYLTLSNQILVDVSSPASLPSLLYLSLHYVVYKDDGSLVRLLSSSPILKWLSVHRHENDNLKTFTVKVSSLESFYYDDNWLKNEVEDNEIDEVEVDAVEDNEVDEVVDNEVEVDEDDDLNGSLVIDSPALKNLQLYEVWDYCLIENMSFLDEAFINNVPNPDDKFLRSLSSVIHLYLYLTKSMVACCNAIKFSRLIELHFHPDDLVDWLMPLIFLLQNSPQLKTLTIDNNFEGLPLSWNQPVSIPGCLLSHLEIFRWGDYGGREDEKQLMTYILANSKCLKTVEISLLATCNLEDIQEELESMPRVSTSSQLLISTKMDWRFND
ncbi:unnamed protein product [Arabidopsis lyrata]|nr:unnamed protein product [Arabidopsis lyrata]